MIKVLVLSADNDGVGYYRVLNPHLTLNDPEIETEIRLLSDSTIPLFDERYLSQYQIIFFNKAIPFRDKAVANKFYELVDKYNIKLIFDIDDYWILNNTHINYKQWKESGAQKKVEAVMRNADAITTTTSLYAELLKKVNPNVHVLENAVNFNEQQWTSKKTKSDKIRFIWGGGISHMPDLRLLKDNFKTFDKDFREKAQIYMCGFDLRIRMSGGKVGIDDGRRSAWGHFESIFTNNYKYVNGKYSAFLMKFRDNGKFGVEPEYNSEFYQRRWTKAILEYGTMYNEADVSLSPLKNNHSFNYAKSQLKLIEAGAHHMPLIASNYGPYTIDDIDGKKTGVQKGFLVNENKSNWYENMKWYVDNPNAVKEHGENMYQYVKDNYEINVINKKRAQLYKDIVKK